MGEPLASILSIAAIAYFDPLSKIAEEKIVSIAKKLDVAISKLSGISI